jgi:hypothetical protein
LLRYLVEGKLLGSKKRALLLTDSDSFQLGATVPVRARVYDREFNPLRAEQLEAEYRIEGQLRKFQLRPSSEGLGWFQGSFVPDRTGSYEISMRIPGAESEEQAVVRREVRVARPNVEIERPRMNREALVGLAEQLEGSAYYEIDEVDQIPKAIPDRHEATTVRTRPTPVWDSAWMLTALIILLSAEWAVRKWARLL